MARNYRNRRSGYYRGRDRFRQVIYLPGEDSAILLALLVVGLVMIVLMLISSLCVWPYLIGGAQGVGERAMACRDLLWIGGSTLAVCAAVSLVMAWFAPNYSGAKNLLVTMVISLVMILSLMAIRQVNLLGSGLGLSGGILTLVLHGILGVMLALVPGVLGMLPGLLLQSVMYFYFHLTK